MKKKVLVTILLLITLFSITNTYCMAAITPPSKVDDIFSKGNDFINSNNYSSTYDTDNEIKSMTSLHILSIIFVAIGVVIYFIPTVIAIKKKHENKIGIIILNIFLGWSLIGWVAALVWAVIETKTNASNKYDDLEKLQNLKANGTITEQEFEAEKQRLLQ